MALGGGRQQGHAGLVEDLDGGGDDGRREAHLLLAWLGLGLGLGYGSGDGVRVRGQG